MGIGATASLAPKPFFDAEPAFGVQYHERGFDRLMYVLCSGIVSLFGAPGVFKFSFHSSTDSSEYQFREN